MVAPAEIRLGAYTIHVGRGLIDRAGEIARQAVRAHRWAIIADQHVAPHYAARVAASFGETPSVVFTVPAGEAHKTRESWAQLTDRLLAAGIGRDGAVLALGGGMVGDLAGFVAATFMRGIPVVQVPTSLLAMIDASLGGKTGVDTAAGKNLVGAFHDPAAVITDPDTLATLPARELRAGAAEAIKHGAIADAAYFGRLEEGLAGALADPSTNAMLGLIARSIAIKADVVITDAREQGRRKTLNFGHTLGHAVETASDYSLRHGEAVAIGMVLEARLAEQLGVADAGTAAAIRRLVDRARLPATIPAGLDRARILDLTRADKKSRSGSVEYALPARIGEMSGAGSGWATGVPDEAVRALLTHR